MVRKSTFVILAGVVFLFIPIPPVATIIGLVLLALGLGLRFFTSS
ncbi:transporter [Halomarina litorea]|nr:transporter [Halomarina sp. BCD28]